MAVPLPSYSQTSAPPAIAGVPAHKERAAAFFGLVAYATYDLTSQALVLGWPVVVTVVDLVWGALPTGIVSVIALAAARFFK